MLNALNQDIWDYPRWDFRCSYFTCKVDPIVPAQSKIIQEIAVEVKYGRAGGETEDHRRLKEYVRANPEAVGLPKSLSGQTEYMFLSCDEIDVLFKSSPTWVGIEVTGPRSDAADIMREESFSA